jgi:hypothetical protein
MTKLFAKHSGGVKYQSENIEEPTVLNNDLKFLNDDEFEQNPETNAIEHELNQNFEKVENSVNTLATIEAYIIALENINYVDSSHAPVIRTLNTLLSNSVLNYSSSAVCASLEDFTNYIEDKSGSTSNGTETGTNIISTGKVEEKKEESKNKLIEWFKKLYEKIKTFIVDVWRKFKDWISGIFDVVQRLEKKYQKYQLKLKDLGQAATTEEEVVYSKKVLKWLMVNNKSSTDWAHVKKLEEESTWMIDYIINKVGTAFEKRQKIIDNMINEIDENKEDFNKLIQKYANDLLPPRPAAPFNPTPFDTKDGYTGLMFPLACNNSLVIFKEAESSGVLSDNQVDNFVKRAISNSIKIMKYNILTKTTEPEVKGGKKDKAFSVKELSSINEFSNKMLNYINDYKKLKLNNNAKMMFATFKGHRELKHTEAFRENAMKWTTLMNSSILWLNSIKQIAKLGINMVHLNFEILDLNLKAYKAEKKASQD